MLLNQNANSKHKRIIFGLIIYILSVSVSNSQVTEQWVKTYNDIFNFNDVGTKVLVDGSGNVYVLGHSYDYTGDNDDIFLIKYGPQGTELWKAEYGDLILGGYDIPSALAIDSSGNVYVAGSHWVSNGVTRFETIKYNSSGVQQWVVHYAGTIAGPAGPSAIAVDGSGNIYVTGNMTGLTFSNDWVTIKYNSNGVQQWLQSYNDSYNLDDAPSDMAIDYSGNIYITGYASLSNSSREYETIKYSPSGVQQWRAIYVNLVFGDDYGGSIAVDGNGNSYVTGDSKGSDSYFHVATVKYNSSGVQQWVQRYNGGGNGDDNGNKVVFKNGFVYVGGTSQGVGTGKDFLAIKYNLSGSQLWSSTYNGPVSGRDESYCLAVDDYGDVYVAGQSKGVDGITHMTTVRYNPNGTQQWVQRYNSGQCSGYVDEAATSIAIGPTGGVLVTGWITHIDANCSFPDCCTIKYTQQGLGITPISGVIPDKFELEQNYPNPFNPSTMINFNIPKFSHVKVVVYDMQGREVLKLADEDLKAGRYALNFDGSKLSSGIYFCKLETADFVNTIRMALVK
jgi:hypothetical protein